MNESINQSSESHQKLERKFNYQRLALISWLRGLLLTLSNSFWRFSTLYWDPCRISYKSEKQWWIFPLRFVENSYWKMQGLQLEQGLSWLVASDAARCRHRPTLSSRTASLKSLNKLWASTFDLENRTEFETLYQYLHFSISYWL